MYSGGLLRSAPDRNDLRASGAVGDVCFHGQRGAARLVISVARVSRRSRRRATSVMEAPCSAKPAGGGGADAAARASDQGGGAGQFRFHGMLSCSLEVRRRGGRQ